MDSIDRGCHGLWCCAVLFTGVLCRISSDLVCMGQRKLRHCPKAKYFVSFITKKPKMKTMSSGILRQHFTHLREWCKDHLWVFGCYHDSMGMDGKLWRVYRDAESCVEKGKRHT